MSWWVGQDREAFNVAVHDHTQRVMRREPVAPRTPEPAPVVVAPEPPPVVVVPEVRPPSVAPKAPSPRWNTANIKKGLCARCGAPRTTYPQHCDRCQAQCTARVQRREGFQAWRPGSRGRMPKTAAPLLETAVTIRAALEAYDELQDDQALRRAAIVMFVGFLFGQRLDWIVGWTGFPKAECQRIVARLRTNGIWHADGGLACEWMDVCLTKRLRKADRFKANVAFLLDAGVANGDFTRETRADGFYYGLPPAS